MTRVADPGRASSQAFLLRVWRDTPESESRFSLEHAATHHRYSFASLEALCAFLARVADGRDTLNDH